MGQTNEAIHEAFRVRARPIFARLSHTRPQDTLEYVLFLTGSCVREAVLAGALAAYPVPGDDKAIVSEVTRAATAYLGV